MINSGTPSSQSIKTPTHIQTPNSYRKLPPKTWLLCEKPRRHGTPGSRRSRPGPPENHGRSLGPGAIVLHLVRKGLNPGPKAERNDLNGDAEKDPNPRSLGGVFFLGTLEKPCPEIDQKGGVQLVHSSFIPSQKWSKTLSGFRMAGIWSIKEDSDGTKRVLQAVGHVGNARSCRPTAQLSAPRGVNNQSKEDHHPEKGANLRKSRLQILALAPEGTSSNKKCGWIMALDKPPNAIA